MKDLFPIAFGVGIVNRYTRNRKLHFIDTIKMLASSIKHMKISANLKYRHNAHKIVEFAYKKGIRIFDTARIYGYSEDELGKVISHKKRADFFICTKISDMDLLRAGGSATVKKNLENSLIDLRTNYIDLYLLHWPSGDWLDIYRQMDRLYKKGLTKHIGVCNFTVDHFKEIESQTDLTMPQYCQIECHPFCQNSEILSYCQRHSIKILAHTPIGRMNKDMINNSILQSIAKRYKKSIAQIVLKWHIQNNRIPITHTKNLRHLEDNVNIFDFALREEEIKQIDSLNMEKSFFSYVGIDNPNYIFNK